MSLSPVGESAHADPDALKHTVASELVHDERGLHLAGLLVGVWHQATHKVWLAVMQGGLRQISIKFQPEKNLFISHHQFHKGDKVDGRHGFSSALLLLLSLLLWRGSWLT